MKRVKKSIRVGDILHTTGKVIAMGDSVAITLPKEWVTEHHLKVGDIVVKVANSMLTINPRQSEVSK